MLEQKEQLQYLVSKLLENYPIQYLIKKAWFYEYPFYVDKRVLIPRPETEELVEMAINLIPTKANILDIGTGSGCIAITLGKKTNASITAIDKSIDALAVANMNAQFLNTTIKFQQLDILNEEDHHQLTDQYDLIISNPPYISIHEKKRIGTNVLNIEPYSALFVEGADVLIFYKVILRYPFSLGDVVAMVERLYTDRVVFHDGAEEIAPGISVHHLGGHTAGLQVVRVHTARGWVVLASDASHFYANMEDERPFPVVYNVGDMIEGYHKAYALASSSDHVIPGHDPLVMKKYPAPHNDLQGIVARLDVAPTT